MKTIHQVIAVSTLLITPRLRRRREPKHQLQRDQRDQRD